MAVNVPQAMRAMVRVSQRAFRNGRYRIATIRLFGFIWGVLANYGSHLGYRVIDMIEGSTRLK